MRNFNEIIKEIEKNLKEKQKHYEDYMSLYKELIEFKKNKSKNHTIIKDKFKEAESYLNKYSGKMNSLGDLFKELADVNEEAEDLKFTYLKDLAEIVDSKHNFYQLRADLDYDEQQEILTAIEDRVTHIKNRIVNERIRYIEILGIFAAFFSLIAINATAFENFHLSEILVANLGFILMIIAVVSFSSYALGLTRDDKAKKAALIGVSCITILVAMILFFLNVENDSRRDYKDHHKIKKTSQS